LWLRRLYRARRILLDGGNVFISADGAHGQIAFTVPLAGGPVAIREGWRVLRRATGATVLPVLSHMEGRRQITTVHPPLPPLAADPLLDLDACRDALGHLLGDYVRRFPDQCYSLAFSPSATEPAPEPSAHASAPS
jgi:lauroyl/myristoyl acyltransferase